MNSFFLSGSLPPNAEGSAEPCEAIGASLRTQVRIFKSCNLCPDSSLWVNILLLHYSHTYFYDRSRMTGKQLILFCKKRFFHFYSLLPLPTAIAATFPDKRGRLTFPVLFFLGQKLFTASRKRIHSCRHSWAVDRIGMSMEKKHHVTHSEESGKGYR